MPDAEIARNIENNSVPEPKLADLVVERKPIGSSMGRGSAEGVVFQYLKNLDSIMGDAIVTLITNGSTIVAVDSNRRSIIFQRSDAGDDKIELLDEGLSVVSLNDNNTFILDSHTGRHVFQKGKKIELTQSPVMPAFPNYVNEDDIIGGCVKLREIPYARLWDEKGIIRLEESTPHTSITKVAPRARSYAIGFAGADAAFWIDGKLHRLRGPNGSNAYASHVNTAGIVGGFYSNDAGDPIACAWSNTGELIDLGLKDQKSYVCGILEDGTFVIEAPISENERQYYMGRPGNLNVLDSSSIQSEENSPLVSIEAVSATGIMVVKLKNNSLGRTMSLLISTESGRRML